MDTISLRKIENMKKKKKNQNKLLLSVNVLGSTGPIRVVVNEDETVTNVISKTLNCYSQQGRLPILSSHFTSSFLLYSPYSLAQQLNPCTRIGSTMSRNFIMCMNPEAKDNLEVSSNTGRKNSGKWTVWLNNSWGIILPLLKTNFQWSCSFRTH